MCPHLIQIKFVLLGDVAWPRASGNDCGTTALGEGFSCRGITRTGDCKYRMWPIAVETACAASPEHAPIRTKETYPNPLPNRLSFYP